jgi:hypothetical protein
MSTSRPSFAPSWRVAIGPIWANEAQKLLPRRRRRPRKAPFCRTSARSSVDRALASGARGRVFESRRARPFPGSVEPSLTSRQLRPGTAWGQIPPHLHASTQTRHPRQPLSRPPAPPARPARPRSKSSKPPGSKGVGRSRLRTTRAPRKNLRSRAGATYSKKSVREEIGEPFETFKTPSPTGMIRETVICEIAVNQQVREQAVFEGELKPEIGEAKSGNLNGTSASKPSTVNFGGAARIGPLHSQAGGEPRSKARSSTSATSNRNCSRSSRRTEPRAGISP